MTECERCHIRTRRAIRNYWGETLCPSCCHRTADDHDRDNTWPKEAA